MSILIIRDLKTGKTTWRNYVPGAYRARPGEIIMKFGQQLRSSIIPEYQWYYIDYDGLKQDLKTATGPPVSSSNDAGETRTRRTWTEEDEARFVRKLESELDKVFTKKKVKALEISRRIQVNERDVQDVIHSMNERGAGVDGPSEEEFMALEQVLQDIITDVHDLSKFVQVNYTGFYKIIKKHDVSILSASHLIVFGNMDSTN